MPQCYEGSFVTLAHVEGLQFVFERAATAPGGLRELTQQLTYLGVAFSDAPTFALARRLVFARTHTHPGDQTLGEGQRRRL